MISLFTTNNIIWFSVKTVIEILILWFVFYRIMVFFEGTRAFQVLKGMIYILIAFLLSQILQLNTLNWLLTKFFAISIIAVLIIFQQELRQGLARLGQQHLFSIALEESLGSAMPIPLPCRVLAATPPWCAERLSLSDLGFPHK